MINDIPHCEYMHAHPETIEKIKANMPEGKTVFYSLADGHVNTILKQGFEHINE